jgi:hypothetical protein
MPPTTASPAATQSMSAKKWVSWWASSRTGDGGRGAGSVFGPSAARRRRASPLLSPVEATGAAGVPAALGARSGRGMATPSVRARPAGAAGGPRRGSPRPTPRTCSSSSCNGSRSGRSSPSLWSAATAGRCGLAGPVRGRPRVLRSRGGHAGLVRAARRPRRRLPPGACAARSGRPGSLRRDSGARSPAGDPGPALLTGLEHLEDLGQERCGQSLRGGGQQDRPASTAGAGKQRRAPIRVAARLSRVSRRRPGCVPRTGRRRRARSAPSWPQ